MPAPPSLGRSQGDRGSAGRSGAPAPDRCVAGLAAVQNSLLTGNFSGKFAIFGLQVAPLDREAAVPRRFLAQFPMRANREIFLKNREFSNENWESSSTYTRNMKYKRPLLEPRSEPDPIVQASRVAAIWHRPKDMHSWVTEHSPLRSGKGTRRQRSKRMTALRRQQRPSNN